MSEQNPYRNSAEPLAPLPPLWPTPTPPPELDEARHAHVVENLDLYTQVARAAILRVNDGLPHAVVQDLQQVTIERALRKIPYGEGEQSAGWVYRVAQNATLDHFRREQRLAFESVDPQEDTLERALSTVASAEQKNLDNGGALFKFLGAAVRQRFKGTGHEGEELASDQAEEFYQILLLKAQEVPDTEIANRLGINQLTIRTRMHRMRKALKPLVAAYLAGEDISHDHASAKATEPEADK